MADKQSFVAVERVEKAIFLIRGQKVMLDGDLAALYGVETRALIQAVKRNAERFPEDFMFRLTKDELMILRSQSVISSQWGGVLLPALRVYRTGGGDALERAQEQACHTREHRDHAGVRTLAQNARF